jgi:hypothetical protein
MNDKVRLNLVVSKSIKIKIETLMKQTGNDNMTQVIREALALYEEAVKNTINGGKLLLIDANNDKTYYKITVDNE